MGTTNTALGRDHTEYEPTPLQAYADGERCEIACLGELASEAFSSGKIVPVSHVVDVADLFTRAGELGYELSFVQVEVFTVPAHREDAERRVESFMGLRAVVV